MPPHLVGIDGRGLKALARKHRKPGHWAEPPVVPEMAPDSCWLCARPLGRRVEWHHPLPKSRGGRDTVPVHPICHRTIHAFLTNLDLERHAQAAVPLETNPDIARFLRWIANKAPDFHAPTRKSR